ncbi:uncharacterized protein METZ01_LOCUS140116 [marine metagenome]|uniref:Uncharacterized protein n=1 Tax=marine metagenome TaxID=408172 RepID=A0A381ZEK4_9ZZZZ
MREKTEQSVFVSQMVTIILADWKTLNLKTLKELRTLVQI